MHQLAPNARQKRGLIRFNQALDRYVSATQPADQVSAQQWARRWGYVAGLCVPLERHLQNGRVLWVKTQNRPSFPRIDKGAVGW
jgi:hypothetical protein